MKLYRVMYKHKQSGKRWVKFIESNDPEVLMTSIREVGDLIMVQEIDEKDGKPVRVIFKNESYKPFGEKK